MLQSLAITLPALLLVVGCASTKSESTATPAGPLKLRVLTYNIHHGAGTDGRIDLPRIAAVIKDLHPDLVALQEVDDSTQRSGGVDQAAELGKLTGLNAKFGSAMEYQGGQFGQAILSRWPIQAVFVEALPSAFDAEPRISVISKIAATKEHPPITFASVHLDHKEETARVPQARHLAKTLGKDDGSLIILAGDFNAGPGSPTLNAFGNWKSATDDDALSYPADKPAKKIDWILTPKAQVWTVNEARVVENAVASDHRPVIAEFERAR